MKKYPTILTLAAGVAWLWPATAAAQRQVHSAPTSQMVMQSVGSVAEMDGHGMVIRSEETESVRYRFRYTNGTRWMNGAGEPVSRQSVGLGSRVTVHYRRGMDGMEVSSVVLLSAPEPVRRNVLGELATTVAALPPNRLPGAPPEMIGPQLPPSPKVLPQIAEGAEPEEAARPEPVVKRRVARTTERRVPRAAAPPAPKKRGWLANLFGPR